MATERCEISQATVTAALDAADAATNDSIREWADTRQPYLVLRQRGKSVSWYVRTRRASRRLGSPGRSYKTADLNLREARQRAAALHAELAAAPPDPDPVVEERPACWTWSQMVDARLDLYAADRMSGVRVRIPSRSTQDDVRRALGIVIDDDTGVRRFDAEKRPSLSALQDVRLDDLTADLVNEAIRGVVYASNRAKVVTYARAAARWAASNAHRSGWRSSIWWRDLAAPDLEADEIARIRESKRKLAARKAGFGVEHVGASLARHEEFCIANNVSPGVRYGYWFVCLTANRRGATTLLRRSSVEWSDPLGRDGWGTAAWAEDEMKGRRPFLLPAPPIALRIIWLAWHDYEAHRGRNAVDATQWVFASLRRQPDRRRGVDSSDISTNPYSLATHLARMRGKRKDGPREDVLAGIPEFSLHTIRPAAAKFLRASADIPPGAASALLDHAKLDDDADDVSPTTERYYNVSQRMPLKSQAMEAWTSAVMGAFERAGGVLPEPYEPRMPRRIDVPPRPW
ncbi:hypothetical protein KQX63_06920 [Rhodopseudomonas palustris]|uniref:hypothetical protein n=1 Tax=Rhodopseudomonas palustris TaxID=1076 RepID=UPI0021F36E15|nr:hypothetical protein [Rhodopseudomonas palustris]UYO45740.1 hypothetical protein KQX63_06920 [Rhodopseudomonas palustris]